MSEGCRARVQVALPRVSSVGIRERRKEERFEMLNVGYFFFFNYYF